MTLTCTSRYAGHGTHCQDRQHPNGLHHGHTDDQCLQWADGGAHFSKPISDCPWPPAYEVAQRAEELGAMIKARRERLTAVAVEHPDDELLRAEIDRLRYEEALATGGLGLYPPHEQRLADDYTPDWRTIELAEQHLGSIDPDLTVAVQDLWAQNAARGVEIERLKAELAAAREPIAVDDLARILCDADKHVFGSDYPGWDDLPEVPGRRRDQIRKAARYLQRRLNINPHQPPGTVPEREQHVWTDPLLADSIRVSLDQADRGETHNLGDFTQYLDSDQEG